MAATLLIYAVTLAVLAAAGAALLLLLRPGGARLGSGALPMGACALVIGAHWLGFLLPGAVVAIILLGLVVTGLAAGIALARRRDGGPALERADAVIAGIAAALGVILLVPLFSLGFPSTIASGIADGWARAILTEWVLENPLRESEMSVGSDRPAGSYSALPPELGAGFEYLAGTLSTLLGRPSFEITLILAAASAPIALCGWARLWEQLADRRPAAWQVLVLAVPTLMPAFVLPYADNYLTQMFSIALWPFAMATALGFFRQTTLKRAVLAAIPLGAIAGVYPPLLPWVAPTVVALAAAVALGGAGRRRLLGMVRGLVLLGLAVAVLAPLELWRAWEAVGNVGGLRSNPAFPVLRIREAGGIVLGGLTQFEVAPLGTPPNAAALGATLATLLVAVAAALATAFLWRPARAQLLALAVVPAAVTAALYLKYKFGDDYGYGGYKALLYGGPLLAGLMAVALASPRRHLLGIRALSVGLCLAVWVPLSADLLMRQRHGAQGFREAERALYQVMRELPEDARLLVEGAAETPNSFKMRMAATYFAEVLELDAEGLGTTDSYVSGGGHDEWRPHRPWTHVLVSDAPTAFEEDRPTIWQGGAYRLQVAEPLDVTPYALARPDSAALAPPLKRFWAPGAPDSPMPVSYIAGPVELIVSNNEPRAQTARLILTLTGMDPQRDVRLRLTADGRPGKTVRVGGTATRTVSYEVPVGPESTALVAVQPQRLELPANQPPPVLVAVTAADVEPS